MLRLSLTTAAVTSIAGAVNGHPITLQAEVLFSSPQELAFSGLDLFPEGSGFTRGGVFGGQPRIDNDGNWYILYQGFMPPNPPSIDVVRNYFMLKNGEAYIREGLPISSTELAAPVADFAFSQQPFYDVSISETGSVAQVIDGIDSYGTLADGTPDPIDLDFGGDRFASRFLVVDRRAVMKQGDPLDLFGAFNAPGVAESLVEEVSAVEINADGTLLVRSRIGSGERFEPVETAIFEIADPLGTATKTLRMSTFDGNSLPGLGFEVGSIGADESGMAFNSSGDFITTIDISGAPFSEDDALVHYDATLNQYNLLARAGQESSVPGRNWNLFFGTPVALTDTGHWAFTATLTGDSSTGDVVVVNGEIVSSEGDPIETATGPRTNNFSDSINSNLFLDSQANVYFYSQWNAMVAEACPNSTPEEFDTSFAIWEGIFRNNQPMIEAGETIVHDVLFSDGQFFPEMIIADVPNNPFGGFSVSPDGSTLITQVLVAVPTGDPCTAATNNDATLLGEVVIRVDLDRYNACVESDLDGDLQFTATDVSSFLATVETQQSDADRTQDGLTDFFDALHYLQTAEDCTAQR